MPGWPSLASHTTLTLLCIVTAVTTIYVAQQAKMYTCTDR